jgi:N-methylhydantoinase A
LSDAVEAEAPYVIGIDVGGTFTDAVLIDQIGGLHFDKAFSTPDNPAVGVTNALANLAGTVGVDPDEMLARCTRFAHGTTVGTNALIQRAGARVGLLMSKGFEDTVPIARGPLGKNTGIPLAVAQDFIHNERPLPLVPRTAILAVRERVDLDGDVVAPLVEADVADAGEQFQSMGIDSVAVCLLWSFRNDRHELLAGEVLREAAPELHVSLSSAISPVIGEYERAMTTIVNAYVAPVMSRYVGELEAGLLAHGLRYPIELMTASGGLVLPRDISSKAVAMINGGPAGGLVAARHLGHALGYDNVISADMGGTSFDVGLVHRAEPRKTQTTYVMQGVPVQVEALKIEAIGAGGGSIASTDGERLLVGPGSAGAEPGPACYGWGGEQPTVTDALVVLGLLEPTEFFGGRRVLDRGLAERAIAREVADPLGLSVREAAAGIYEVVTSRMRDLIRQTTVESGLDPRTFALIAYGGASPLHAASFAHGLGVLEVIVPYSSSVFSALGCAVSDVSYPYAKSTPMVLDGSSHVEDRLTTGFESLESRALTDLGDAGHSADQVILRRRIDARYVGQMTEITVDLGSGPTSGQEVARRMTEAYETRYGAGTLPKSPVEVVTLRIEAVVLANQTSLFRIPPVARGSQAKPVNRRTIYLRSVGDVEADVYDGDSLRPGVELEGPAIVYRRDTTILIPPGHTAWIDGLRNTRLSLPAQP